MPYTIVTDGMDGALFRAGKVSRVIVGADRVARNGDFANKVGTYAVAVLARAHAVPFHPVAPWSTVDCSAPRETPSPSSSGRPRRSVAHAVSAGRRPSRVSSIPRSTSPRSLVTSLITERGVFPGERLAAGELARLA